MVEPTKQASSMFTEYGLMQSSLVLPHKNLARVIPVQRYCSGWIITNEFPYLLFVGYR